MQLFTIDSSSLKNKYWEEGEIQDTIKIGMIIFPSIKGLEFNKHPCTMPGLTSLILIGFCIS